MSTPLMCSASSRTRGTRCEPEERPVRADMIKAKLIHVLAAH